eukprot:6634158-Pyramimonas_sp.AAC.1
MDHTTRYPGPAPGRHGINYERLQQRVTDWARARICFALPWSFPAPPSVNARGAESAQTDPIGALPSTLFAC